jgi:hypothetical protein
MVTPAVHLLRAGFQQLPVRLRCICCVQAFSNSLYALAVLRLRPPRQWSSAFFRHSLHVLPACSLQSLTNITWALAKLRYVHLHSLWWQPAST